MKITLERILIKVKCIFYFLQDWSYVFKPPTICKYVGSSKYAPLNSLPSQLLPVVTLPPNCVYKPKPTWQQSNSNNISSSDKSVTPISAAW